MNADIKHVVSKSETCLVSKVIYTTISPEVYSKTKCYSKSIQMLELSIASLLYSRMLLYFQNVEWVKTLAFRRTLQYNTRYNIQKKFT